MMTPNEYTKDTPCPCLIVKDVGIGFTSGMLAGSFLYGIKGFRNAPRGKRFIGGLTAIKTQAPILAYRFSIWSCSVASLYCSCTHLRQKDDKLNLIISGVITGGVLNVRKGVRTMAVKAITYGAVLTLTEHLIEFIDTSNTKPQVIDFAKPPKEGQ